MKDVVKALVIPSNRPEHLRQFFEAWRATADWDLAVVVFDGQKASLDKASLDIDCLASDRPLYVVDWSDIDRRLGDDAWIISRCSSGVRVFGYLVAAQAGAEVIVTTDDDCLPAGSRLCERHLANLFAMPAWTSSVPGVMVRGVPYRNPGRLDSVAINVGLWQTVADYDAPRSLVENADRIEFRPQVFDRVIPAGQYVPASSMNLAFRREALPLMYMPLMGRRQRFDRFEDIWCGVIAKRVCDRIGWHVAVGHPVVDHHRASNPFVNLVKEAAGIAANEWFWERIDRIELASGDAAGCMREIGLALESDADDYLANLGRAIQRWLCVIDEK